jgi:putative tricarboxylic transport membrane protein
LSIFWSNGLVGSIFGLAMLLLVWPLFGYAKSLLRARERAAGG